MEEQTEDTDYFEKLDKEEKMKALEIYHIKKKVRVSFKRTKLPPLTDTKDYKCGKIIGRGAFGKVNLALHKLTWKLVAVKSINRNLKHENNKGVAKISNEE